MANAMSVGDIPPFNPDIERDDAPAPAVVLEQTLRAQGADIVVSATIGVVAADKGADELHDRVAIGAIEAALAALTDRNG